MSERSFCVDVGAVAMFGFLRWSVGLTRLKSNAKALVRGRLSRVSDSSPVVFGHSSICTRFMLLEATAGYNAIQILNVSILAHVTFEVG